ncbi:MAG TPA: hypothetical protein VFO15_17995 [Xanthobacteraceae bacterium]|nr:hypothetical protein [Xanthobacteraceae bacterium]
MPLTVVRASAVAANVPFTVTVPAQQQWRVFSVCAVVSRAAGGIPNRAYQLALSDGTTTFVTSPAADAGTEPGTCTVTWCNGSPASVASGATGVSLGPLTPVVLNPGYKLIGTVLNGTVTDQWTSAVVWVEYTDYAGGG